MGPGEERGEDAGPCAVQEMQDGRSQDTLWLAFPALSPSQYGNSCEKNRDCLFSPPWHGEEGNRSCLDLSVHFLSIFPGD